MMFFPVMAFVPTHTSPWVAEVSRAFTVARMSAQLSQKAIAIDAQIDEAHLSQQINAHGLNLNRLVLVRNRTFWRVFLRLLAEIVDCADLLVNPIATDVAHDVVRQVAAMRVDITTMQRELDNLSNRRSLRA